MTPRGRLRLKAATCARLTAKVAMLERALAAERHYSEALTRLARNPACKLALKEFRRASTRLKKLTTNIPTL